MDLPLDSLSGLGLVVPVIIGLSLCLLLTLAVFARPRPDGEEGSRPLEALLRDIARGLRKLSSPARAGGLFYRETEEEVGRLLAELQGRLRHLDASDRGPYEARIGQVLAEAAHAGITLPSEDAAFPWDLPARR